MDTTELYNRLTAATLASLYYDLTGGDMPHDTLDQGEAAKVLAAGIANCGEWEFDSLVMEIAQSANA